MSVQVIKRNGGLLAIPSDAGGGMRGGDRIEQLVTVRGGASMFWLPPAATLYHGAAAGDGYFPSPAEETDRGICGQSIGISVSAASSLIFAAKPGIPCIGSRVRQRVRIEVERGGELLYMDCWTAGRAASGELWSFDWIDMDLEYREGGLLRYAEKWLLSGPMAGPAGLSGKLMWITGIAHGERTRDLLLAEMNRLRERDGEAEIGVLGEESWLLKGRCAGAWDLGFNP